MPKINGRFYIVKSEDGGWDTIDDKYGMILNHDTKIQALDCATFSREYVKRHGDINFGMFPYTYDQPFEEKEKLDLENLVEDGHCSMRNVLKYS